MTLENFIETGSQGSQYAEESPGREHTNKVPTTIVEAEKEETHQDEETPGLQIKAPRDHSTDQFTTNHDLSLSASRHDIETSIDASYDSSTPSGARKQRKTNKNRQLKIIPQQYASVKPNHLQLNHFLQKDVIKQAH